MASEILTHPAGSRPDPASDKPFSPFGEVRSLLMPLASLRLTVVLFALSILLIFIGTLAQVSLDVWDVVRLYFRTWYAWVPFQVFFPPAFFPSRPVVPYSFPFPGGWSIGVALGINLLAAHALRFKIQAQGGRLIAGLGVIALGAALTWLVILGGSGKGGVEGEAVISWYTLWTCMKLGLTALVAVAAYGLTRLQASERLERHLLFPVTVLLGVLVCWLWFEGDSAMLADASLRILWQLIEGTLAGLVILGGCAMVFRKRAGVVLLHAGVGLMMANELVVHRLHSEGFMHIYEGQTVNYVDDSRATELAVIDKSPADHDEVTVVPGTVLFGGNSESKIQDSHLPFDVKVVKYLRNSQIEQAQPGKDNPATAGAGLHWVPKERVAGVGTDTDSKVDMASAYLELFDKQDGHALGTYLVNQELHPQHVDIDGKTYNLLLRFQRTYQPYSMRLDDVSVQYYPGTKTPKDYRSKLQLVDPSRNEDRRVELWMNHPFRFAGETFYQSGYQETPKGELTTLQVVKNTGWMLPYVACMLVVVGLVAHFFIILVRFLRNRDGMPVAASGHAATKTSAKKRDAESVQPAASGWLTASLIFPAAVVLILACWVLGKARVPVPPTDTMALYKFGEQPLMYEGRVKPFDTLARNSLRIISGKETFLDSTGKQQPAIRWLLDVMTHSDASFEDKIFRIDNAEVLATLGLEERAADATHRSFTYSIDEFRDHMEDLIKQLNVAQELEASKQPMSLYQRKLLALGKKLKHFMMLSAAFSQPRIRDDHAAEDVMAALKRESELNEMHPPLAVPPESSDGKWQAFAAAWTKAFAQVNMLNQKANPATLDLESIFQAYRKHDAQAFNAAVVKYGDLLAEHGPSDLDSKKVDFEAYFNHFEPFYNAAVLYLIAFVLAAVGWLKWTRPLNRAALWLNLLALTVHSVALVSRMYISGRPPVTNLYSSAVFIGWGCVVLGLVFEYIYRLGIGNVVASITGFSALLIAHMLADGDTFTVLQAVLDTNFWLAFHVTCITLGYATTYLAGILGLLYVLRGMLTPSLTPAIGKELSRMIYGTLCFALFFSFFGTVLGGLWADDSWGRFWGWDPKENGALIIVLWNALVLHARWGGLVKQRGLAVLAIGGNVVTSWSWFGVNELGVGLHSYGFTEGVLMALGLFVLSQLAIAAIGSLPISWRSNMQPAPQA